MPKRENPAGPGGVSEEAAAEALSAVDITGPQSVCRLDAVHLAELEGAAVPAAVAEAAGVYTAYTAEDLPEAVRWVAEVAGSLPALVYPMHEVDGTETCQVKPQAGSVTSGDGRALKYVGPRGAGPQLPVVRDNPGAGTVLVVEGCKQALSVSAAAGEDVAIHRITGVYSWKVRGDGDVGVPTPHLRAVVDERDVVIIGDADAATNIMVFDGLTELGEAAKAAGAASVRFVRVPGKGKQGVDDVLAGIDPADRAAALRRWIADAMRTPADLPSVQQKKMRKARADRDRRRAAEKAIAATASSGRVDVLLEGDFHVDCTRLAGLVADRLGGSSLFRRGDRGVECVETRDGVDLRVLKEPDLHRHTLSTVRLMQKKDEDSPTVVVAGLRRDALGILAGHLEPRLPEVVRVSRAPVVRPDGSVVAESGYDAATGVLVDLDPGIQGLSVPEHPTDDDLASAVHLLRDRLFEMDLEDGYDGWVFASEADRTHAIALLLTALMRSAFTVVPLALLDGLQRGVGKGALVTVIHLVVYGSPAAMMATPSSDTELEKRISAELLAGRSMIVLDEVMAGGECRLASPALLSVLTNSLWGGRLLGQTESLSLRQEAVWAATGNNVAVPGDMVRRVFPIRLASDRARLDERDNFRHDLDSWVPEHRRELLEAALTLIRAWYDRGQPVAPTPFGFVSYTEWQRVIGGVLHLAGLPGFLSTVLEMRATADSETIDTTAHLEWVESVATTFKTSPRFTAKDVLLQATVDPSPEAPYNASWGDLDSRSLGRLWAGLAGRWYGDVRIMRDGKAHGNVSAWRIERQSAPAAPVVPIAAAPAPRVPGVPPAPAVPVTPGTRPASGAATGEVIAYRDRGRAAEVPRAMPPMAGLTIAELGEVDL